MKLKSLLIRNFNYTLENQNFSTSILEKSENVYLFVSLLIPFGVCIYMQYFFKYLPELIKRRSKVQEKNMSS